MLAFGGHFEPGDEDRMRLRVVPRTAEALGLWSRGGSGGEASQKGGVTTSGEGHRKLRDKSADLPRMISFLWPFHPLSTVSRLNRFTETLDRRSGP